MNAAAVGHAAECACAHLARVADLLPVAIWITCDGEVQFENESARDLPNAVRSIALRQTPTPRAFRVGATDVFVQRAGAITTHVASVRVPTSTVIMRELYGLSAAEARVASALAYGSTPREAAEGLGVSLHTVRTHLRNLFAKTGTRCQNGLVARLNSGVAALRIEAGTFTQLGDSAELGGR